MSLVFASICPHPPLLIPSIGKENLEQIKKTVNALEKLEERFYQIKPDALLIISPHAAIYSDAFSLNLNPEYYGSLEEFGDFSTKLTYKADLELINKIKNNFDLNNYPLSLDSYSSIDHGITVPLYYLAKRMKNLSLIPMGYSLLDLKTHFECGNNLKKELLNSHKRIAVIASGDLSHCLTPDAPAGYSPKGKEFDQKLIELISNKNTAGILNLDVKLIEAAKECGLRSFLMLLGLLERINYTPEILSYEGPFGVGYLVVDFKLE